MQLTEKQQEGLRIIVDRYREHKKYTTIAGYAGTGKSTLVKFAIEALDIDPDLVAYTSYTGKAAEVLRKKGNLNASTLHRLLYNFVPKRNGGFYRTPKIDLEYRVVVVDEISMVPRDMVNLLLSHSVYVIFLGDPFQIPPIDKDADNGLLEKPHIFLTEIMRQAAESEIIQLTMQIREGKPLSEFVGKEVQVLPKNKFCTGMLTWADQIIVAKNATRKNINNQMRKILNKEGNPQDGDKLVCLRNYWDTINTEGANPLVNGTICYLKEPKEKEVSIPNFIKVSNRKFQVVNSDIVTDEGDVYTDLSLDKNMIITGNNSLDWKDSYLLGRVAPELIPLEFEYGYAITCHKAQGSEWGKILVVEERFPFDKTEHARWLYTAATRAAEKLVIIKESY